MHLSDSLDTAIVRALERKSASIPTISKRLSQSPRTIAYRLARLRKRHVVERTRGLKAEYLWHLGIASKQTKSPITIYRGKDMIRAYSLLRRLPRKTIIYSLEGYEYLMRSLKSLPTDVIADIQRSYRKKGITIKSILHYKCVEYAAHRVDRRIAQIHKDRSIATGVSRRHQSFLGPGFHCITPSLYLAFNEKKKYGVVIRDPDISGMLYDTLKELFNTIEYMDDMELASLNKWIDERLHKAT